MYAIVGRTTGELLTYNGLVLVHPDKEELEYLLRNERIIKLPGWISWSETTRLVDHPDMQAVQFPLKNHMNQFR